MKIYRQFKKRHQSVFFTAVIALAFGHSALARDLAPIVVPNSLPLMEGLGLSAPRQANLSQASRFSYSIGANIQSHANDAGSADEALIIDAEVQRVTFGVQWALSPTLLASLKIGALKNTSGALDGLISNWHSTFGLPEGDRSEFTRYAFLISYQQAGIDNTFNKPTSGLSDTQIELSYQAIQTAHYSLAMHAAINLPTGDAQTLTGSQKSDFALELSMAASLLESLGWHLNAGVVFPGDETVLGLRTKSQAWTSSAGLHWQANENWGLSAQLDGHGPIFESEIEEINSTAWQLGFAVDYDRRWQFYFAEDLSVNKAADFSVGLNWRSRF